ncbi:hypothetical protein J4226_00910 [Candidatus Pacearchaeota archaeon]|nr:hypothetical protein [Candidatus Pacearchaeota archaeon]
MIDVQEKKRKIIEFLKSNGPSLPIHVARIIQMEPIFASAILSELLGTKQIKTSNIRVGASPLYLLPGQEELLEAKTENLKSIERETQEKLKSKTILIDEEEEPATRIALRNIKDFAIPFKFKDKIVWKYAFTPQEKVDNILFPKEKEETKKEAQKESATNNEEVPKAWEIKRKEIQEAKKQSESTLIKNKNESLKIKKTENILEKTKEKTKTQETFLKKIEQFLSTKNTKIKSLEEVDKKKVVAIVETENSTSMLFAFNKAKIDETELLKCYKIADKKNLPYQIIINNELTKKLLETISAHQKLIKIDKLEN